MGLVTLAVPESIRGSVASHPLSPYSPQDVTDRTNFSRLSITALIASLEQAKAVVVDRGSAGIRYSRFIRGDLSRLRRSKTFLLLSMPIGLNALAGWDRWWDEIPRRTVITPHPGEMARLLDTKRRSVQADRFSAATGAAHKWDCTVVLKGANTIVATPSGMMTVNPTGGPNLGTGGTGDVLSGMVGSFLAQGLDPQQAAVATAAAWIHGPYGDALAKEFGDSGTISWISTFILE